MKRPKKPGDVDAADLCKCVLSALEDAEYWKLTDSQAAVPNDFMVMGYAAVAAIQQLSHQIALLREELRAREAPGTQERTQ
jgi:hypothetical protein